jgi:hypothetical protein
MPPLRMSTPRCGRVLRSQCGRLRGPSRSPQAAGGAAKTDTFLGDKYRRIARRRGSKRAIIALGRSFLAIAWHLLFEPGTRFHDLVAGRRA